MNSVTEEYKITKLDEKNLSDIEKLHTVIYGKKPPSGYFRKKYDTAYTGVINIGFIAYNPENCPIAYYGVIPCFIQEGEEIILAAQSADTMTHPAYRNKGLFMKLANICFDLCRKESIKMIFGFPNQNSYHGFIKLGWKKTETMDCFIIPVNVLPIQNLFSKFIITKKLYKKFVGYILGRYLLSERAFPNSVIADGYAGVRRNIQYMRYKKYSDTQVIRMNKSELWIKISNGLVIGDIAYAENNFDEMIDKLKKISKKLGTTQIHFHACKHTRLHSLFSKRYNSVPSFPVLFHDFGSNVSLEKIKFTFADIDIF